MVQNNASKSLRKEKKLKVINKVIIGMLIFFLVIVGAIGTYSYNLSQEINALTQQLSVFQKEETARIGTLSSELTTFRGETLARIKTLDDELSSVASRLSESMIDVNGIYQRVSQAIVKVSDGQRVIGTGFVLDAKGHIVTPQHVVQDRAQIDVILSDGTLSVATVTGTCKYSDIAVLTSKEASDIKALTLVDSTTVMIGEPVIVIGNPLDLPGTITSGIVSQTNRFVEIRYDAGTRWVANLIQFDAAVNFGNSGSPLLNSGGEVIGMVIGRVDPTLGDGIYYAVSSNKAKRVADSLIDHGSFDYPWLGVEIANLTPETVRARGLETTNGVLVRGVITGTPAEAAGVKVDDIIVGIKGVAVREVADLTGYLGEYTSRGEVVKLEVIRNGAKLELSFTVDKRP
jgi:S1-C subfamily serine protease